MMWNLFIGACVCEREGGGDFSRELNLTYIYLIKV